MRQQVSTGVHSRRGNANRCITYDPHRWNEDSGVFVFYETWESRPLWEDHMKSAHLVRFGEAQGALTESWDLFVGEKL